MKHGAALEPAGPFHIVHTAAFTLLPFFATMQRLKRLRPDFWFRFAAGSDRRQDIRGGETSRRIWEPRK